MRYVLYQPEPKVPLSKELDFIANYIAAEESRLRVSFNVQGKTNGLLIEPLLLIPFVERALEHASTEIVILISGNELTMEIRSDTLQSAVPENIIRRLNLLYYGKYVLQSGDHEFSLNLELHHAHG
jgi:LytS/YehU family sensor histidine kinase